MEREGRIQDEVARPHEQCLMESQERLNRQEAGPKRRPGNRPSPAELPALGNAVMQMEDRK